MIYSSCRHYDELFKRWICEKRKSNWQLSTYEFGFFRTSKLNHFKKHDTSKNKALQCCDSALTVYYRKCQSDQGLADRAGSLNISSSSTMSLLLLVSGRGPDRLTGCSVFQRHKYRSRSWWRGGRERVRLTVYAGFEGSCRGKLQWTEKNRQRKNRDDIKWKNRDIKYDYLSISAIDSFFFFFLEMLQYKLNCELNFLFCTEWWYRNYNLW